MSIGKKSSNVALLGLFIAITVVLQLLSYAVKIGTFNLSLVLIPIVLAAVLYGPKYGAVLGFVFGAVVTLASAFGLDAGGFVLFQSSPILTSAVCLVKGTAAGFFAGLAAKAFKNKVYLAVAFAAVVAPIVNTGIFVAAMFLLFKDTLIVWANGADVVYYAVVGLVGINFVIEFVINIVLSPAVLRVTRALRRV